MTQGEGEVHALFRTQTSVRSFVLFFRAVQLSGS